MISFCPTCANLLLRKWSLPLSAQPAPPAFHDAPHVLPAVENHGGENFFVCPTCPYQYQVNTEVRIALAAPLALAHLYPYPFAWHAHCHHCWL